MDLEELSDLLDSSLIFDSQEEYNKLLKSQQFSLEDLLLAYERVISSTNIRYQRYIKYITFDGQSFFIKVKINEYFTTADRVEKIKLLKQIDKSIIDFVEAE